MNKILQSGFRAAHFMTQPLSGIFLHNSRRSRILLVSNSQVLLIKTSFGTQKWSLPGGGMHKGEDKYRAAARELREETGVVLDPSELKTVGEARLPRTKRWPVANIYFFAAKIKEKPATNRSRPLEIMEIKWFPLNDLPVDRSATVDEGLRCLKR